MPTKDLPSPDLLRKLLRHEPETGQLFWRERTKELFSHSRDWKAWNARYAGAKAGSVSPDLYQEISIFDCTMKAHRVIWAMITGTWPKKDIDHEDHDRGNN